MVIQLLIARFVFMSYPLIWGFLFSYYADETTEKMASIGKIAFASNWYYCPTNVQKYMLFIIARSQKPAKFTGLRMLDCSLEVFKNVSTLNFEYSVHYNIIDFSLYSFYRYYKSLAPFIWFLDASINTKDTF